jgi:hypothetical protein
MPPTQSEQANNGALSSPPSSASNFKAAQETTFAAKGIVGQTSLKV